jgi:hypothetical protein
LLCTSAQLRLQTIGKPSLGHTFLDQIDQCVQKRDSVGGNTLWLPRLSARVQVVQVTFSHISVYSYAP